MVTLGTEFTCRCGEVTISRGSTVLYKTNASDFLAFKLKTGLSCQAKFYSQLNKRGGLASFFDHDMFLGRIPQVNVTSDFIAGLAIT